MMHPQPFTHSGTRRPTVAFLPTPVRTPALSASVFLFPMFALGFLSGVAVVLVASVMWP